MLTKHSNGEIQRTIQNCITILQNDHVLADAIRLNLLSERIDIVKPVGWPRSGKTLNDTDMKYILRRMEKYGISSEKKIESAIRIVANENRYHPIRDYLNGLKWDGTERIAHVLHHFLGAAEDEYACEAMKIFPLGAIKRVFQSGCKFETMLCLVGGQGAGKSSFFRLLAVKDEWFSDDLRRLDDDSVYHTFPDRREGSKSSLILKKPKAKKSNRVLYMTKPLKEELLAWLEKLKQDEQNASEKYSNCGQLFRLPDGLPIAPELLTKWYRLWRAEHLEFEQIVFHGLRHSSATYQLLQSDGDFKSVQGNTGHATASVLMDTYAHTQDKPRLELTEKIEANFYSQDLTPAAPQSQQNEKPAATKISGKEILEAIRLMDADERRELTRALFA